MAKVVGAVEVDIEVCKGCELCVECCPFDVLAMTAEVNSRGYHYSYMINPKVCNGCGNCAIICPDTCITVYRVRRR